MELLNVVNCGEHRLDVMIEDFSLNVVVSNLHNCSAKSDNTDKVGDCHHTVEGI